MWGHNQWGEQDVDDGHVVEDVVLIVIERVVDKPQGGRETIDPEGCRHDPDEQLEVAREVRNRGHPDPREEPIDERDDQEGKELRERQQCDRDLLAPT